MQKASQTASWVNSQPWKVYVATGETLEKIKSDHRSLIEVGQKSTPIFPVRSRTGFQEDQHSHMAAWSNRLDNFTEVGNETFWQLNQELFQAPAIMYFALPKNSPEWSILDMGAFLQTASLSANNQGLATMVAYELVKFPGNLAQILRVDSAYEIVIGMALGYESDHPVNTFRPKRQSLDKILKILD
ncbi:nitroreductase family protein [Streptococcus dentasini]